MSKALTPKQRSALDRVKRNPDLQPILFRKVHELQWFDAFKEFGFLDPASIPVPQASSETGYVTVPNWHVTEYLVNASSQLKEPANADYAKKFMDFIRETSNYGIQSGISNYRVWWKFAKVMANIPVQYISREDVDAIDYWLDDLYETGILADDIASGLLANLLDTNSDHARTLATMLLQKLYKTNFIEANRGGALIKEVRLRFDNWHAQQMTEKIAAKVGGILGLDAIEIFKNNLATTLASLNNDNWSCVWRPAIEEHEQNGQREEVADIFIIGLRDALSAYVQKVGEQSSDYVAALLNNPLNTLKRIGIYIVDKHFETLHGLSKDILACDPFSVNLRHEFWHFLKNCYPSLSNEEKIFLYRTILVASETDKSEKRNDAAIAYSRAIWFSAIKEHDKTLAKQYEDYVMAAGSEPEHPDFASYMTTRWGGSESPIPKEELLNLGVEELAQTLATYQDPQKVWEPGIEGLTRATRAVIKTNPNRYYDSLAHFLDLDLAYIYEIIEGYSELWAENAQLPWNDVWTKLLTFCEELIKQDRFWNDGQLDRKEFVATAPWIVGAIGRLIENGTKRDEHAFSEVLLGQAEGLLLAILERQSGSEFNFDSDAVSIAINSPRGRCLEAFINLSLRACRLEHARTGNHAATWSHFEPFYSAELHRKDGWEYEFATLIVNYLPNFLYMSKPWVLSNLATIFDSQNNLRWHCAMQGYAYVANVYQEVFRFLKEEGHFLRALNEPTLPENVGEKVVQNIVVAYLNDFDSLEDNASLISTLIKRAKQSEINQLIWFIWSLRKAEDRNFVAKVFALWRKILPEFDFDTKEGRQIASHLCDWVVYVDTVNDHVRPLIDAVVPYAGEEHNSYTVLEWLAQISERQPGEAHRIWMKILERSFPDFPQVAVEIALRNILRHGEQGQRMAKQIVDHYLKAGNEQPFRFLRSIEV